MTPNKNKHWVLSIWDSPPTLHSQSQHRRWSRWDFQPDADSIAAVITTLFNLSLKQCTVSSAWKKSRITPIQLPLSSGSNLILYADDILLYKSINTDDESKFLQMDVDSILDGTALCITRSRKSISTSLVTISPPALGKVPRCYSHLKPILVRAHWDKLQGCKTSAWHHTPGAPPGPHWGPLPDCENGNPTKTRVLLCGTLTTSKTSHT